MTDRPIVVLAFSGGLDTSYCLVRLRGEGFDVVTAMVNTGGMSDAELAEIEERATELGAVRHVQIEGRQRLYDEFITYLIKANYLRNGVYPSCVGVERMLQAEEVTRLAFSMGAAAIAHGSTGAGNDHVRFDATIRAIAPEMEIIAPIRDREVTREVATEFLRSHGIDAPDKGTRYSVNQGLMGTTIGGGETYGSWDYLPESSWHATNSLYDAPAEPDDLVITFDRGNATGSQLGSDAAREYGHSADLLGDLNELAAQHGVGRGIHTGVTITGIGARLGFEAPGAMVLITAHRELERLVLSGTQQSVKATLGTIFGDLLHEAHYFEPVLDDIRAFLDASQWRVSGEVRVRLHKGHVIALGCRSQFSLMEATSRLGTTYGHGSSAWSGDEMRAFARVFSVAGQVARGASTSAEEGGGPDDEQ